MDFISTFWEKEICMEDFSRYFINISVQVLLELAVIYICCRITKISNTHLRLSLKWYQRRLCKSLTQKGHDNGFFSANFSVCKSYYYLNIISAITHQKNRRSVYYQELILTGKKNFYFDVVRFSQL